MRSVLRNRNLRIFLGMDVLSLTGSSALWLALGIWVKALTGSTSAAGMVIFAILAPPVLLAPAAGMLVDRVRRRPLLVVVMAPNANPSKSEILDVLGAKIAKWQMPDDVVFVDALPMTATGKISKKDLRTKFADYTLPA